MQEMGILSLHQEDPLEKEIATHSSILAWEIPWKEEPDGLQSMGSQESNTTQTQLDHHHLLCEYLRHLLGVIILLFPSLLFFLIWLCSLTDKILDPKVHDLVIVHLCHEQRPNQRSEDHILSPRYKFNGITLQKKIICTKYS